jgi:hypothetical protein
MRPADTRHRGPHPADAQLFAAKWMPVLQRAVAEPSWLLARGCPSGATLKLVAAKYALTERQRWAVGRATCTDVYHRPSAGGRASALAPRFKLWMAWMVRLCSLFES